MIQMEGSTQVRSPRVTKRMLFGVLGVFAIGLLAGGGYWFYQKGGVKADVPVLAPANSWSMDYGTDQYFTPLNSDKIQKESPNRPTMHFGGVKGNSIFFDQRDYKGLIAKDTSKASGKSFTISLWFMMLNNPRENDLYSTIVAKGNNDGSGYHDNYMIYVSKEGNRIGARIGFGGQNEKYLFSQDGIRLKEWYHVVLTADNLGETTAIKMYVDGVEQDYQVADGSPYQAANGPLTVGYWQAGALPDNGYGFLFGDVDEIGFYNSALDGEQVSSLYKTNDPPFFFSLDEPGPIASDRYRPSPALDMSGGSAVTGHSGSRIDFGRQLNGSSDFGTVTNSSKDSLQLANFTASAWFKQTGQIANDYVYGAILAKSNDDGSGYTDNYLITVNKASGKIVSRIGFGGTTEKDLLSKVAVNDGLWHHVALVSAYSPCQNKTRLELYVDGKVQSTAVQTGRPYQAKGQFTVGAWATVAKSYYGYFPGVIDAVKIYDKALSASEITATMNTLPQ